MSDMNEKPTYEELEAMLAKTVTTLAMMQILGPNKPKSRNKGKGSNPLMHIIGGMLGQDASDEDAKDDKGEPICYKDTSRSGQPTITLDIAPGITLPIEIIGTHEAHCSLNPIQSRVDQGNGFTFENEDGKEIRQGGYYEVLEDSTIFACIQGMHIRIGIQELFQAILMPDMHDKLTAARNQFNELNNAAGASPTF